MTRKRPFVIGLTGSIGMGKSTAAGFFKDAGIPVWDADAAVHRMYGENGAAVDAIMTIRPQAVHDGKVDREALKKWIAHDETALNQIEAIVHPLVAQDRTAFLASIHSDLAVLDIPLLFETGQTEDMDLTVVVSASPAAQRERVMQRPGMTEERFQQLLSRQMPDVEKRAIADIVLPTESLDATKAAVQNLIREVREKLAHA